jgi:hypothetical protein
LILVLDVDDKLAIAHPIQPSSHVDGTPEIRQARHSAFQRMTLRLRELLPA